MKTQGDGLPGANTDRKMGSEPSAPSLEREGKRAKEGPGTGIQQWETEPAENDTAPREYHVPQTI